MARVKVSPRGGITIPEEIRARYGICPGDELEIVEDGGRVSIQPSIKNAIERGRGLFRGRALTGALLEDRRAQREREEMRLSERPQSPSS
ncbi:MAG: AbrB/MazE/SpoVT family DNA-binding domain-containing protein [Tepidiformaceae bacterium]